MHITNFNTYILHSLKIFFLAFIIGKSIDNIFIVIQKKYEKVNRLLFGLLQLLIVIVTSYYLHILTSRQFSADMQIYTPNVLFSSFIFSLQSNMLKNFAPLTLF
jgi:hypothetical protein